MGISTRLTPALCAIGIALFPQPALSQPVEPPPASSSASPTDQERRDLEIRKLRAEVEKLGAEIDKARLDSITGWIAPTVNALTLIILAATLFYQRGTALKVQARQNAAALRLQKRQGDAALQTQAAQGTAALELKIVELIMSSRSPALASMRADLLSALRQDGADSPFLNTVKAMAEAKKFPGDLGFETRTMVFEEIAAKCKTPTEVADLARKIFPKEEWLKGEFVPESTLAPESEQQQGVSTRS